MRLRSPTSKSNFNLKLSPFDIFWAVAAPFIALGLRDPGLLELAGLPRELPLTLEYALVTIACSIMAFLLFKVSDGMTYFFSVHDVLTVCGAVAVTVVSSSAILFFLTRMEGVPRSTPLIYGLVLGSGMIVARTVVRALHKETPGQRESIGLDSTPRNLRRVLLIGVDRFSATTIKLTDQQRPRTVQVVAALDAREALLGRSISGVKIVGRTQDLGAVVDEYAVHGVDVDEVWLSDDAASSLTGGSLADLTERCAEREIKFARISEALNLTPGVAPSSVTTRDDAEPAFDPNDYFKLKRVIDVIASAALLFALLPLAMIAACLVLSDVGVPVLFWQQRIGLRGRKFLLYKFRTYHAPFDKNGVRTPEERRLSKLGRANSRGTAGRNPATFERSGRRHVVDRPASASAGRPAERSAAALVGAARHHRVGPDQRRHVRHAGGKGRARRVVCAARVVMARPQNRREHGAVRPLRRADEPRRLGAGDGLARKQSRLCASSGGLAAPPTLTLSLKKSPKADWVGSALEGFAWQE